MTDHHDLFESEIRLEDQKAHQRHMEETERQGKLADKEFSDINAAIVTIMDQNERAELANIQRFEALKESVANIQMKLKENLDHIEDTNRKTLGILRSFKLQESLLRICSS
jgi:hypothetical protein